MVIETHRLNDLYDHYQAAKQPDDLPMDKDNFNQSIQAIERHFPDYFNWETCLITSDQTHAELMHLLHDCCKKNSASLTYNDTLARLALMKKQQQFLTERQVQLHATQRQGVQEKYLRSQLTAKENLTDIDLKRFIAHSGLLGQVGVIELNSPNDLAFYFANARIENDEKNVPYPVATLLNYGSKEVPKWACVILEVSPNTHKITADITVTARLSTNAQEQLKQKITEALAFKTTTLQNGEGVQAFHDHAIEFTVTNAPSTQAIDGNYQLLHRLCASKQLENIVVDKPMPKKLKDIESDIYQIKSVIYEVELRALKCSAATLNVLPAAMQNNFRHLFNDSNSISHETLVKQLELLNQSSQTQCHKSASEVADRAVGQYLHYNNDVTFPNSQQSLSIKSNDYYQYITQLNTKITDFDENKQLDKITLVCYDISALIGCMAFLEQGVPLASNNLSLDLSTLPNAKDPQNEAFMFHLKTLLLSASNNGLKQLSIIDPNQQLSKDNIADLASFICERQISIDVNLPSAYANTLFQRNIDEATQAAAREKSITVPKRLQEKTLGSASGNKLIRTRKAITKENVSSDIELDQDNQAEVAVAQQASNEQQKSFDATSVPTEDIFTLAEFKQEINFNFGRDLNHGFKVSPNASEADNLWRNWIGEIPNVRLTDKEKDICLTKQAVEQLLLHDVNFQYGLDLNNLPDGFFLNRKKVSEEDRLRFYTDEITYIHYDPKLALIAKKDPLKVQLKKETAPTCMTHNQFSRCLNEMPEGSPIRQAWNRVSNAQYDKKTHQAIKQHLPTINKMTTSQQEKLFELIFDDNDKINIDKLSFLLKHSERMSHALNNGPVNKIILEKLALVFGKNSIEKAMAFFKETPLLTSGESKHLIYQLANNKLIDDFQKDIPNINLDKLLDLYLKKGEPGLRLFKETLDSCNEKKPDFTTSYLPTISSYEDVLSEHFQNSISALNAFSDNEKVWFHHMYFEHCKYQPDVDFVDMVDAFKAFKTELSKIETSDGNPLLLPSHCHLDSVKSMPTGLSRLLTLLRSIPIENRECQARVMGGLELASAGMIKELYFQTNKKWHFIHPAMNLLTDLKENFIASYKKGFPVEEFASMVSGHDEASVAQSFLRVAAYQERKNTLNFDVFNEAYNKIQAESFSLAVIQNLYPIIAAASTGLENAEMIGSSDSAKHDIDLLITKVKTPPLTSMLSEPMKNEVRLKMLTFIKNLKVTPPLPIIGNLVSLISASLSNPLTLPLNISKLNDASEKLNDYSKEFHSFLYQGMKHYSPQDYENKSLLYHHLDVVGEISRTIEEDRNNDRYNCFPIPLVTAISAFHLTKEDIKTISQLTRENSDCAIQYGEMASFLMFLPLSVKESDRPLTGNDLINLFKNITPECSIIELIKTIALDDNVTLASYCPEKLLNDFALRDLTSEVKELISTQFLDQHNLAINELLHRFQAPGDAQKHLNLVMKLSDVYNALDNNNKNIFVANIKAIESMCIPSLPLNDPNNQFVALLNQLVAKNAFPTLSTFLNAQKQLLTDDTLTNEAISIIREGFAEKSTLYISTIENGFFGSNKYPLFDEGKLKIQPLPLITLLQKTLLKTPTSQLHDNYPLTPQMLETNKKDNLSSYNVRLMHVFSKLNTIVAKNHNVQSHLLVMFENFSNAYDSNNDGLFIEHMDEFASKLENAFSKVNDPSLILSLCLQFKGEHDYSPADLIILLDVIDTITPQITKQNEGIKASLLKIATLLINNDKNYTHDDFKSLCNAINESADLASHIESMYVTAPYPSIEQVLTFHQTALNSKADISYSQSLTDLCHAFDLTPCEREVFIEQKENAEGIRPAPMKLNGFHADIAHDQLQQFEGFESELINVAHFQSLTIEMQSKSVAELVTLLKKYDPKSEGYDEALSNDDDTLVAVAAELLYRSKGCDKVTMTNERKLGSSMEINTTQYLAILSAIKSNSSHVVSQIDTGEGKSRIMMVANVCQFAKGKTVDFVTSDVQLATRDFVEYKAYFDTVGAQCSMIFGNSDPSEYVMGGINFSDPSNLSLFRNKARSLGLEDKVIDPDESNRSLLLDEADKTLFDVADTRFNYSTEGDEAILNMEWVYPLLIDYFSQTNVALDDINSDEVTPIHSDNKMNPTKLFYANVDKSRESFLDYAAANQNDQTKLRRLKSLSNEQVEQWMVSAVTASQLEFKKDFVIEADQLVDTKLGPKQASTAQLVFSNRVAKNSKFSYGVHQCLHARLNAYRDHPEKTNDELLKAALLMSQNEFILEDEKQIIYSSTSQDLLDDYQNSTLIGVTGTPGSDIERAEASALNGIKFIGVPRDKTLKRDDHGIYLTQNNTSQTAKLIEKILEAKALNQPILIISESDIESEEILNALEKHFPNERINHIHSQTSLSDEQKKIDAAGVAGQITISTDMVGRGTDIKLKGVAQENGLNVMLSYLPRLRDLEQVIGRAGRNGAKGETSIILDETRLLQKVPKEKLTPNFYKRLDTFIAATLIKKDRTKQVSRLLKSSLGRYRRQLTNNFYKDLYLKLPLENQSKTLPLWSKFVDKCDKEFNEKWPLIQSVLEKKTITDNDIAEIDLLLADYREVTNGLWGELRQGVSSQAVSIDALQGNEEIKMPAEKMLFDNIPLLALNSTTKKLLLLNPNQASNEDNIASTADKSSQTTFGKIKRFVQSDAFKTTALATLGAAIGVALILTGILAPVGLTVLGLTAVSTSATLAGALGAAVGASTKAISSFFTKPVAKETQSATNDEDIHVSMSTILDKLNGIPPDESSNDDTLDETSTHTQKVVLNETTSLEGSKELSTDNDDTPSIRPKR